MSKPRPSPPKINLPGWLKNPQVLALILLAVIFFLIIFWREPAGKEIQNFPAGVMQPGATPIPTEPPPNWSEDPEMTNGIVLMGLILVTIVLGGTLSVIFKRRKKKQ